MKTSPVAVESLEDRTVPAGNLWATGTAPGVPAIAKVFDSSSNLLFQVTPFGDSYTGGIAVAVGDVTGDGVPDLIVGSGINTPPMVNVYDGATHNLLRSNTPFENLFTGGVRVATADLSPNGAADIVVTPATGGGPIVKIFNGQTGNLRSTIVAFEPGFRGGLSLCTADLDGDQRDEILVGAGHTGGPRVRTFRSDGSTYSDFFAYDPGFRGGVNVAAGNLTGTDSCAIVTGPGVGGGPQVRIFDGITSQDRGSFFAGDSSLRDGVQVCLRFVDGSPSGMITTTAGNQTANFDGTSLAPVSLPNVMDPGGSLGSASKAGTDVVHDWIQILLQTIQQTGVNPPVASRAMAMVGIAMNNALAGFLQSTATPQDMPGKVAAATGPAITPAPAGTSLQAAIVTAAAKTLEKLFPTMATTIDGYLSTTLAAIDPVSEANNIQNRIASVDMPDFNKYLLSTLNLNADSSAQINAQIPSSTNILPALKTAWLASLAVPGASDSAKTLGITYGTSVASAILAARASDGSTTTVPYTPSAAPGDYQLTPPAFANPLLPNWGNVTPFGLSSIASALPPGPPSLTSETYATALNEVQSLGSATSTTRTADQTQIANFWADSPGASSTPPGHWMEIALRVSRESGYKLSQNAPLFALLGTALADAAIVAWNAKYNTHFWRPITAIREAGTDGNNATTADASWTPLLTTPNFPTYISGHSTFSGAASTILDALFGSHFAFRTGSAALPGVVRSFASFDAAAAEAGVSRIYGGIHFSFDNEDGLTSGSKVASSLLSLLGQ